MESRLDFARQCRWHMGKGKVSFWFDNWNLDMSYETFVDGHGDDNLISFWKGDHWNFDAILPSGEELVHCTIEAAP